MGCCISKCNPKKEDSNEETNNIVQDKLVISQAPISPIPSLPKKLPSPYPSPISSSSYATFSSATSKSTSSVSLSSSSSSTCSSSSVINSKERSFSNDFIWSCVKENPHIIGVDIKPVPSKVNVQKLDPPAKPILAVQSKQSTPKKRARANSPTFTRQKSLRKEPPPSPSPGRTNGTYSNAPCRTTIRPPSPSRRFNNENYTNNYKGVWLDRTKEKSGIKVNYARKENVRPASPSNNFGTNREKLRNRGTCTHRIGPKIDEMEVDEKEKEEDIDSIPIEDIDNPLIALDCFIFL